MPTARKTASNRTASPRSGMGKHPSEGTMGGPQQHTWTFLSNHAHVLIVLHSDPELVLREVAQRVGITERAVQRIVQELEQEGYLKRQRVGRCNRYIISRGKHLRHPVESHCKIDQLLSVVSNTGVGTRKLRSRNA